MIDTVLFDLDGTLLPMRLQEFGKLYMAALSEKCAPYGYEPQKMVATVWTGTEKMLNNSGEKTNADIFWAFFEETFGSNVKEFAPVLEDFYQNEFHKARAGCGENPLAAPMVRQLREKGYTVALTTNPVFPLSAVEARLSWLGLEKEDFDLITFYENSRFCKPSAGYFADVLETLSKQPGQCLMVGNDVHDDGGALEAGLDLYLVTDDLMHPESRDISGVKQGSFKQLDAWLDGFAPVEQAG